MKTSESPEQSDIKFLVTSAYVITKLICFIAYRLISGDSDDIKKTIDTSFDNL